MNTIKRIWKTKIRVFLPQPLKNILSKVDECYRFAKLFQKN
jgi:hypothetical protein